MNDQKVKMLAGLHEVALARLDQARTNVMLADSKENRESLRKADAAEKAAFKELEDAKASDE